MFYLFYELRNLFVTWKKHENTRPTFKNTNFESMDEFGKVISQYKCHCLK